MVYPGLNFDKVGRYGVGGRMAKREPGMQSIRMREKMGGLNPPIMYSRLINKSIQWSAHTKLNFLGLGNIIYSNITVAVSTLLL